MNNAAVAAPNPEAFLIPWSPPASDGMALVCIPWAGAGAVPFRSWGPVIGDVAAVYGVRLPGRENRHLEPLMATLGDVVGALVSELAGLDAPRVALFGQCSGALLAFEVAKALVESGDGPMVANLVVASQVPPRVFANTGEDLGDLTRYVPEDLRDEPELIEMLLPILAADLSLLSGYAYSAKAPLDVPLTVVYGACDEKLTRAEVDGWRCETTGPSTFRQIAKADHLFSGAAWLKLAKAVRATLA